MSDQPPSITSLPIKPDELLAGLETHMKLMRAIPEHAATVAAARYALFTNYVKAGFTEAQALELCKGSLL